jgi:hypothetical protein
MKLLVSILAARAALPSALLGMFAHKPSYLRVLEKIDDLASTVQRIEKRLDKIDNHLEIDTHD